MARLRPGRGDRITARLRRLSSHARPRQRPPPASFRPAVVQRHTTFAFPGHSVSVQRRCGALRPKQSRRRLPVVPAARRGRSAAMLNGMLAEEASIRKLPRGSRGTKWPSRCRTSVPELSDFSKESRQTLEMYGVKQPGDGSFASNCLLLARRLAEQGVHFIQLYHRALGPSRGHRDGPCLRRREKPIRLRPLLCRISNGEDAGRRFGHLGRRVRPHANEPGHRAGPPYTRLLALPRRRRASEGGLPHGATDELGYPFRARRRFRCTTSTPRCSSFAASITRNLLGQVPRTGRKADWRRTMQSGRVHLGMTPAKWADQQPSLALVGLSDAVLDHIRVSLGNFVETSSPLHPQFGHDNFRDAKVPGFRSSGTATLSHNTPFSGGPSRKQS